MAGKLKACPFCGARGVFRRASEAWIKDPNWTAGCDYGHAISPDLPSKDEAADWWNRRSKPLKSNPTPAPTLSGGGND